MDFFKRYSEAAQAQAKLAASSAGKLAEQLGDQTKVFAEQASTFGKATAEQAQQKLKDLHLSEHLDKLAASHHQQPEEAQGPSLSELRQYGITPEFKDFVRCLTYSTFRDYPVDELDTTQSPSTDRQMHYLLPWQERHAMLIVQSVKEINELRFVLCPKRMTDEQFWKIYFSLTKKQLPDTAFDPTFVPEGISKQTAPSNPLSSFDIQSKVQQLSSAARQLGEETTARLRSAAGTLSSQSPTAPTAKSPKYVDDLGELAARGLPDKDAATVTSSLMAHQDTDASVTSRDAAALDQDLDDYLKDANQAGNGHNGGHDGSDDEEEEGNDEFDKYINELEHGAEHEGARSAEHDGESSGEELDIDEYMKDLQAEEANRIKE